MADPVGIVCPACGCADMRVVSTFRLDGNHIRRYRQCRHCQRRIITIEAPPTALQVLFPRLFPRNTT